MPNMKTFERPNLLPEGKLEAAERASKSVKKEGSCTSIIYLENE